MPSILVLTPIVWIIRIPKIHDCRNTAGVRITKQKYRREQSGGALRFIGGHRGYGYCEDIADAIKSLWKMRLFSQVEITVDKNSDDQIF